MERISVVGRRNDRVYIERSEVPRVEKLLQAIPSLTKWTPLFKVARDIIKEKVHSTISTARLLWNAEHVERDTPYGREILATYPILELRKNKRNTRTNLKHCRFLRAPIYIKAPETSSNTTGGPHK